jgi:hypothetical protein
MVTREQSVFRLAFAYREDLVNRARALFYSHFDPETSTWTGSVCTQNLEMLKSMYYDGLIDVPPENLLEEGEVVHEAPPALLRAGSVRRCYMVSTAQRDETMYAKLKSIPGAMWEKKAGAMSYPSSSGVALAEFVDRGLISDPDRLLSPAAVVVAFDSRSGKFAVRGDDDAKKAFNHYFPGRDVVTGWQERGHDVAFDSPFSQEVYFGELARDHGHLQPKGLNATLYPFQAQAVAIAVERTGFGVFDSPGLGKTLVAIATGYEMLENRKEIARVLCVVPGSARTQWAREITRFTGHEDVVVVAGDLKTRTAAYAKAEAEHARWVIVNYDILTRDFKHIAPLASGTLLVADEAHRCFPAGTTVLTDHGPRDIREIVENRQSVSVLAWDEKTRTTAYKPVTDWMSNPAPQQLVRVRHASGELTCTATHPIWTEERGYVPANELKVGETLRHVPDVVSSDRVECEVLLESVQRSSMQREATTSGANLRVLQSRFPDQTQGSGHSAVLLEESRTTGHTETSRAAQDAIREKEPATGMAVPGMRSQGDALRHSQDQATLLHGIVRCHYSAEESSGTRPKSPRCCKAGQTHLEETTAGHCGPNASQESDAQSGVCCQDVQVAAGQNVPLTRRERETNSTAIDATSGVGRSANRVSDRDRCSEGSVSVAPYLLQSGLSNPRVSAGRRSGRTFSQFEEMEILGSAQGVSARGSRVDSIEIFQRDGAGESPSSGGGDLVYNLEVADLNSYVADGVVVHNCKNPTAKRTQAIRKLGQRAVRRLALTGTPIENEPGEWFSILSGYAIPNIFGSAMDFLGRYQYPGRFGGYEGARRLPELRDRSKPHYIRHTKAQVAQHLPPLRPYTIRLDPDPVYATALRRAHQEARDEIKTAALARQRGPRNALDTVEEDIATAAEMTAVGMLKLLCISPRLVVNSTSAAAKALCAAGIVPDEDGPKLDYLRSRVAEYHAENERVIVFCSSRSMTDLVAERFTEDRIPYVLYTGETSDKDRDAAVLAFTTPATAENPGPAVMIATDAGSEALNLGKCCSTIINLDVPWKATTLEQRGNRVHRIDGTAAKYEVINLVLTGTLEHGLLTMVERKADLQDAILGESGGRTRTTGGKGRNFFEQALENWSVDPE